MPEYLLPDVGEGLTEAEIVSWKVKVGDTVAISDIVCEIETAKSIVELPSPFAGVVSAILAPEGETIAVGTPIIAIGDDAAAEGGAGGETPRGRPPDHRDRRPRGRRGRRRAGHSGCLRDGDRPLQPRRVRVG